LQSLPFPVPGGKRLDRPHIGDDIDDVSRRPACSAKISRVQRPAALAHRDEDCRYDNDICAHRHRHMPVNHTKNRDSADEVDQRRRYSPHGSVG
jgi:hypothetical protein